MRELAPQQRLLSQESRPGPTHAWHLILRKIAMLPIEHLPSGLQFVRFAVDEAPFCAWEWDLRERNLRFIESLAPEYFEHVAQEHSQSLDGEQSKLSAVALRLAYGQALEAFFSILFASLQAPDCVPGWLAKYKVRQVHELIEKIQRNHPIFSKVALEKMSWTEVSGAVHGFSLENSEREKAIKNGFGDLWARFAYDFTSAVDSLEYNSIKHGLRLHPGGFTLRMGWQDEEGVPALPERTQVVGSSPFGCSLLSPEEVSEDKRHFRLRRVSSNWVPENLVHGLILLSQSLRNVISFLRSINGVPAETVRFAWPEDLTYFRQPWALSAGVRSFNMDVLVPPEGIVKFSGDEILAVYSRGGVDGS